MFLFKYIRIFAKIPPVTFNCMGSIRKQIRIHFILFFSNIRLFCWEFSFHQIIVKFAAGTEATGSFRPNWKIKLLVKILF